MSEINVYVEICREGVELSTYAKDGDAGMDIRAAEDIIINPQETVIIPTGFKVAIPKGYEIQVRPRSGLALKHGITVLNTPGTIDEDYRGEIGVILMNHSGEDFVVNKGDRIAQICFCLVAKMNWKEVETLDETERNTGGFGHTGK